MYIGEGKYNARALKKVVIFSVRIYQRILFLIILMKNSVAIVILHIEIFQ